VCFFFKIKKMMDSRISVGDAGNRIEMFGCEMHAITMEDSVDWIADRIESKRFTQHVVVNVAKIVNVQLDKALADSIHACDLVNIDGMGVVWAGRLLGYRIPERVAGIDLFDRLLKMAAERAYPVFFLGATSEVLQKATVRCRERYPQLNVAGAHHGYFWDDEEAVVDQIKASGARLLFVAITSPMKENFINRWKAKLGVDFVMGVGGTFDVMAGKVQRAPAWMQASGLEWFYRVVQEPGRMWKRYLTTNSRFALMVAGACLKRYRA
jgi:N-acetylglucosaminyldiphosphoundecaprenol N-acetyl-beta-D-mannosaminyltransferase